MKSQLLHPPVTEVNRLALSARGFLAVIILSLLLFIHPASLRAAEPGKRFATPTEAVNALGQAARTTDRAAFHALFGPDADWLANPDTVQGAREIADFNAAFAATNWLDAKSDKQMTLVVGTNAWPFPIPLVKGAGGWYFDTAAGRDEILNRRIGRNELAVLDAVRAYVDAQRDYASQDRDNSHVLKYAQKIVSSPGKTDGLYWPPELNGEISPLGPLVADAQNEGYFRKKSPEETGPQPFHGYFFKILTQQGKHAPGVSIAM